MAKDLQISERSVRRIVSENLGLRSYRLQSCHALSEENKKTRVIRCRKLLERAAQGRHRSFIFSDEKLFTIEAVYNRQNDRIISPNIREANNSGRLVPKKAHSASVMVSAFVTSDGKSPLIFVDSGVKITGCGKNIDRLKRLYKSL
ncbi:hypothetical protein NECAME_18540 [Necator americanus]|uniref:Transposase n=1 Tax=Necator americanus TaxID=51031 RepID=W2STS2_NECAM|nr:hypothetical protein NECAME_18540 [Necator americanus]ETN73030.1 hypothetical protein NECAME_18540 [Necator americanus]